MLLWSGQTVSVLGSRISATAVPLLVLAVTGSPATAGIVGFIGGLPFLLVQLPAGVIVDRWDRWRILLVSDVVRLVAVASVPVALWLEGLSMAHLAAVVFLETALFVVFELAESAALPMIVPAASLPAALAQNEARSRGAALAGQPLGGALFGLDQTLPFVADTCSYLLSTAALLGMRRRTLSACRAVSHEPLWREAVAGVIWLVRHGFFRNAALLCSGSNLVFEALMLVVIVLAMARGASPALVGVVLGCWGFGGLLGSLLAPRLRAVVPARVVVIGVNWIWVVLLPLLLVPGHPLFLGVVGAAAAFVGPLWNVVCGTYLLTLVPNHLLGRVRSASLLLACAGIPLGSLAGGFLLELYGGAAAVWILSGVMLVLAVAATASPAIRRAPPLPAPG